MSWPWLKVLALIVLAEVLVVIAVMIASGTSLIEEVF
jgi:hypothetical protein